MRQEEAGGGKEEGAEYNFACVCIHSIAVVFGS
jgi:hypothetical protein